MGLTSALNTSLNGLALNENTIDVLGNNIANAGTNGFKASTTRFQTQLSRTLSVGSRATPNSGGTNPRQIGLGASVSVISRDFTQGSITNSTSPSDLAIQGNGFFVLEGSNGVVYSRNGNFSLNSEAALVNDQGMFVQGYGIDSDFNLVTTQLTELHVPLGDLHVAQQTGNMALSGALLPTGELGTQGSILTSEALRDNGNALAAATGTTLLTDLRNSSSTAALFTNGQSVNYTPKKGGRTIDAVPFTVTATSTVNDFMTYMDQSLAIVSQTGAQPADASIPDDDTTGGSPGVSINASGQIVIVGNAGVVNDIDSTVGDITADDAAVSLAFLKSEDAVGEGTGTDFVIYDSLGQPVNVRLTTALESRDSTSTSYRWYIESVEDSRTDVAIATGVIKFNSLGIVSDGGLATFALERTNTAAVSPMQVTIDFRQVSGISTASAGSRLNLSSQDGSPPGTLQSFVIDENGVINGVFDNGIIRTLGQIALARFANPDGLIEDGSTTFKEGVSSGAPFLVAPGTFGVGTIRAGAIELSNTDIGKNLVDLIVASTNYRGNARVISSVQQLVDELLLLGR
ncbi:MAG TPA: flagellar hook-basal body complex protein [Planctomycetaceae bacterium]|nr:flagellar hook-basal body complex protein [Planctomycetaceae bacterium]